MLFVFSFSLRSLANYIICERCWRFLGNYCINAYRVRVCYHHFHIIIANNVNSVGRENFKEFSVICYYLFHCCLVFDYGYKVTTFFSYLQIFFDFFILFFHCLQSYIYIQVFPCCLRSSLFLWSCVPLVCWSWSCVLFSSIIHAYTRTYTRAYTRTRTGIFRR